MKYTWFLHHQPLSPVSSDDRGQGSRSACPSIGTHMGWQTVQGFVYLFFFLLFTSSLSSLDIQRPRTRSFCPSQTGLTSSRETKRIHGCLQSCSTTMTVTEHMQGWHVNDCSTAPSTEGNRLRRKIKKKKKKEEEEEEDLSLPETQRAAI